MTAESPQVPVMDRTRKRSVLSASRGTGRPLFVDGIVQPFSRLTPAREMIAKLKVSVREFANGVANQMN
jgi:hypothetical protein